MLLNTKTSGRYRILGIAAILLATLLVTIVVRHSLAREPNSITHGSLVITAPFVFVSPPAALTAGGYLTIENTGQTDDVLIGGSATFAGTTAVHEMKMVNDVMKMRHLEQGLVIPAGETVDLKPGGFHVMFMGLSESLLEGMSVRGTLTFKETGSVNIEYQVIDRKKHMSDRKHKHGNH